MKMNHAEVGEPSASGIAARAIGAHCLAIVVTAIAVACISFLLLASLTPRYEATAYVEAGRLFKVDVDGLLKEEPVVPAVVLAAQVNSPGFFVEQGQPPVRPDTKVTARVAMHTEDLELKARAATADAASSAIADLVQVISVEHRTLRQPALDRLNRRQAEIGAELQSARNVRNEFQRTLAGLEKSKDTLRHVMATSLLAQASKDVRDLERAQRNYADAIDLMQEKQTRLVGSVVTSRTSILPSAFVALFAGALAALFASAVVSWLAYRRARKGG
jgi:hypothetical protein